MSHYLLILPIGLLAQFIDGTMGMGYGVSSSSLLLAAGFMPAVVSASVHTAEVFTSLASGISHLKLGNVDWQITLPLTFGGVFGGVFGAYSLANLDGNTIRPYVALMLMLVGARILFTFLKKRPDAMRNSPFSRRFLVPLGLIGGTVDAIGGGGWGPICTSALISTSKKEPRYVVGSVNSAEFLTTLAITITFAVTLGFQSFLWGITLPLIAGGLVAAPLSAFACRRVSPAKLGLAIGLMLIGLNLHTVAPLLFGAFHIPVPQKLGQVAVSATIAAGLLTLVVRTSLARQRAIKEEA